MSELEVIVDAVDDQISIVDHVERDLDARFLSAQSLRQSILRHAFSGQLVPQDPNDEPASQLLKRTAAEREQRVRPARAGKQARPGTRTSSARARRQQ